MGKRKEMPSTSNTTSESNVYHLSDLSLVRPSKRRRVFQVARPASHFTFPSSGSSVVTRSTTLRLRSNGRLGHRKKDMRVCTPPPDPSIAGQEPISNFSPSGPVDDVADTDTTSKPKTKSKRKNTSVVGFLLIITKGFY